MNQETEAVRNRYSRRAATSVDSRRYSVLTAANRLPRQERQRAMLRLFQTAGLTELGSLRLSARRLRTRKPDRCGPAAVGWDRDE